MKLSLSQWSVTGEAEGTKYVGNRTLGATTCMGTHAAFNVLDYPLQYARSTVVSVSWGMPAAQIVLPESEGFEQATKNGCLWSQPRKDVFRKTRFESASGLQ